MKKMKKFASILLALVMAMALTVPALADDEFSITIQNQKENVSMQGNTYEAYKLFDVTYSSTDSDGTTDSNAAFYYSIAPKFANFSYSYTATEGEQPVTKTVQGADLVAYVSTLTDDSAALNTFAEEVLKWITSNNVVNDGEVTATMANSATIPLNSAGYYLVSGKVTAAGDKTVIAACSLDTVAPKETITVKADAPTITKKIVEGNERVDNATSDVGDVVNFEVTSKVPVMTGYETYTYTVNDTMSSGLTLNDDDEAGFVVKIGGNILDRGTDYTVKKEDINEKTFELTIPDLTKYEAGQDIVITYSATVNSNALSTNVETNTVSLTYSNNPNDKNSHTTTPDDKVFVYDFDINIDKYASGNAATKLDGAKFVLYKENAEGAKSFYSVDEHTRVVTWIDDDTDETTKFPVGATEVTTGEDGKASFTGIAAGTYYLLETEAPAGYNPIKQAIKVVITVPENFKQDTTDVISANQFKVTFTDAANNESEGNVSMNGQNGTYFLTAEVPNGTGAEMPETGGIGTTIFYTLGGLMVVAAGVLLVTKRRMQSKG